MDEDLRSEELLRGTVSNLFGHSAGSTSILHSVQDANKHRSARTHTLSFTQWCSSMLGQVLKAVMVSLGALLRHTTFFPQVANRSKEPVPAVGYIPFTNRHHHYGFINVCKQDSEGNLLAVSAIIYLFSISSLVFHWVSHTSCEACQRRHLLPVSAGKRKKSFKDFFPTELIWTSFHRSVLFHCEPHCANHAELSCYSPSCSLLPATRPALGYFFPSAK